MRTFRRSVQVGIAWLAAATMLIAGVPHSDCVCPNGNHKPFCLGLSGPSSGCCCGGDCCLLPDDQPSCCQDSEPGPEVEASCCTASQEQPNADASHEGSAVRGSCCQRTPALDDSAAVLPTRVGAKQDLTTGFHALPVELAPVVPGPMAGRCPFSWQSYELPPPTDLVIALQHFLI